MRRPTPLFCLALTAALALALAKTREVRGDGVSSMPGPALAPLPAPPPASACPPGMILVPRGTAALGAPGDPDALAPMTRAMGPFCIGRTEVTVAEYRACVASGACLPPETTVSFPGYGPPEPMRSRLSRFCNAPRGDAASQEPMNCVDHASAVRYCAAQGGRLPDEEEWEYAARGPSAERFPWGATVPLAPGGALCWDRRSTAEGTCAVGQFPAGASPVGALDMAGNVWEWTSSRLAEGNVVRGGGWTNFLPRLVSATYRWPLVPQTRLNCVGFRCVHDAHD